MTLYELIQWALFFGGVIVFIGVLMYFNYATKQDEKEHNGRREDWLGIYEDDD